MVASSGPAVAQLRQLSGVEPASLIPNVQPHGFIQRVAGTRRVPAPIPTASSWQPLSKILDPRVHQHHLKSPRCRWIRRRPARQAEDLLHSLIPWSSRPPVLPTVHAPLALIHYGVSAPGSHSLYQTGAPPEGASPMTGQPMPIRPSSGKHVQSGLGSYCPDKYQSSRSLQARVRALQRILAKELAVVGLSPVVRRVLHRIVGWPSRSPTAVPSPCLYPTGGRRRLLAPILHGGPQIPREVPVRRRPARQRRPASLPNPLVPALSRSCLLTGMKTIAQSSPQAPPLGTRRAIAFQDRRTRAGRLHQIVYASVFDAVFDVVFAGVFTVVFLVAFAGRLSRLSRRSGNPEPFLCADTLMATGKRQAWASPGRRSVLQR